MAQVTRASLDLPSGATVTLEITSPRAKAAETAKAQEAKTAAFKRQTLLGCRPNHFGSSELASLLNHFLELADSERRLDRATFREFLRHSFTTSPASEDGSLLDNIFTACDGDNQGSIAFSQFAYALSTIFRGERHEIRELWFDMYDADHDGQLTKTDMERLLGDVDATTAQRLQAAIKKAFAASTSSSSSDSETDAGSPPKLPAMMSKAAFLRIMERNRVIPAFFSPHKQQEQQQPLAFRSLAPNEREVLALLGSEMACTKGNVLITENTACTHFYFIMDGRVELRRHDIRLSMQGQGTFLGEAALFDDVKQLNADGTVEFTTSARVVSRTARILRLNIRDFLPLVYHEHPGATAIVQRLGRIMMERFQQTEQRLQALLAKNASQSEAGMRLSSKDWLQFRTRLTRLWSLRYHKIGRKGKLEIVATKQMGSAAELSVAYSPGVAEPCLSIAKDPELCYEYTAKGHLVGVVTNGTAVLGLGNIGPLAAKPVMEGKAVLFKKFADIDAFDLELSQPDPVKLVDMLVAMEPTFGGINLEDIKSPECFYVEREAQRRMNIPVFHDDQHGTAIIAGAGLVNALQLVNKDITEVKAVVCGCGAAGFTCARYFVSLGVQPENMIAVDVQGVVYKGRPDLTADNYLTEVAIDTPLRTLQEAIQGADVFLGLSAGNLLKPEMLLAMARDPVVFACANPTPEIDYDLAKETRGDVIMATGRSDFPNQINNVCAFPYIFRGALDCRAKKVNEEMKLAATHAIARLAQQPVVLRSSSTLNGTQDLAAIMNALSDGEDDAEGMIPAVTLRLAPSFGREYIIPKPFDERLLPEVASAVVEAAIRTGVARASDMNIDEYRGRLTDLGEQMRHHW
ncbi:hypothetical protein WJX72_003837 [[Myrmecia] bisecta]|uniref:Malic enzyme n=1 Tax=[Myrmecia] bisecta TaxID=41462 RepID=A0AAW1QQN5_9CHLO